MGPPMNAAKLPLLVEQLLLPTQQNKCEKDDSTSQLMNTELTSDHQFSGG